MITFKGTIKDIINDIPNRNQNFRSFISCYFFNPGFRVLLNFRIGKYFFHNHFFLFKQLAQFYKVRMITKRNCDISYKSQIGKNVRFPHPIGIVIGEGVVIGNNCKIFQQVTFGSHGKSLEEQSYPVIKDNVKIYAGAKIIGSIIIEDGAVIGANSVVTSDVPENSTAVGIPSRILNK